MAKKLKDVAWKRYRREVKKYEKFIKAAAKTYKLDPYLLHAVFEQESGWDPDAEGKTGDRGLGQITPIAAEDIGADYDRMFEPEYNINSTAQYLAKLRDNNEALKSQDMMLTAYNMGPGNAKKRSEPSHYGRSVMNYYDQLKLQDFGPPIVNTGFMGEISPSSSSETFIYGDPSGL